jgi:chorismate mutase/prephenate dehydratase
MAAMPATDADLRRLDLEIVELMNRRAALTLEAPADGSLAAEALDGAAIQHAVDHNDGPLPATAVRAVFRELLSGVRAAINTTRVAYLGPEYTYSHLAAIAHFGQSVELVPVATIAAAFDEVWSGQSQFAVVPIENSTDGRVADSLECLARAGAASASMAVRPQICGEIPLRIHHCLFGRGTRAEIRRVCSKPQALSQCRNWLAAHLPGAKLEPTASTAEAASLAAAEPDTAAIGARQAAINNGLNIIAENIEDNVENITRFAVIGAHAAAPTGRDKTSLVFEAPHEPGALADAMSIFKRARLNLTWIESFPIPSARGRYLFFTEFQGHATEPAAKRAIAALTKRSLRLEVLGSYAEASVID